MRKHSILAQYRIIFLLVYQLKDVRLHETDQNAPKNQIDADSTGEFKRSLEALPLAFSFQDGVVAELCTSKQEKTWVLNVKRGILSALQNSMDDLKTDQTIMEVGQIPKFIYVITLLNGVMFIASDDSQIYFKLNVQY